jgi:thiosulfate/3-mercaptopyruvate sulfurtransferase
MKRLVGITLVGIVVLSVTIGTAAGDGFLMGDDVGGCSTCGSHEALLGSFQSSATIRPSNGNYENPRLVTYVDELKNISDPNVVIMDVRPLGDYAEGHIPGAINVDWAQFRGPNGVFIGVEDAAMILGEHGIRPEDRVIVYCGSATGPCPTSAYVFWVLEYLGHENVSVLDGGFNAWCTEYGCTKNVTTRPPALYTAQVMDERFADTEWVEGNRNNTRVQVVDARTAEEYNAGRIDGALNLDYNKLYRDGDRLKGADNLDYLFSPLGPNGLDKSKDTVVYCLTGGRSSAVYLALRMMGYQVRNYDESWAIWSETHPVPTIPISNVSVTPSLIYKGGSVMICADVELSSEGKQPASGTSVLQGGSSLPFIPGATCPNCGGAYAVPTPTTGSSYVRAYIHNEAGSKVATVPMADYTGDGRYTGEWETYTAEDGSYYVDIEATDGVIKTLETNEAQIEVATDTGGPAISSVSVSPCSAHPGTDITIYATVSDPSGVATVLAQITCNNKTVRTISLNSPNNDGQYSGTWRWTHNAEIGTHSVTIMATDKRGNGAADENTVDFVME